MIVAATLTGAACGPLRSQWPGLEAAVRRGLLVGLSRQGTQALTEMDSILGRKPWTRTQIMQDCKTSPI